MSDILTLLDESEVGEEVTFPNATDLIQAERMVATIKESNDAVVRIKQLRELVNHRADSLISREETKIKNATDALEPFVKGVVSENLKVNPKAKKSLDFLTGSAGFRKGKAKIEVEDEEKAIRACNELSIKTIIKVSVSKSAVMDYVKNGGNAPDGTKYVEGDESFSVKTV